MIDMVFMVVDDDATSNTKTTTSTTNTNSVTTKTTTSTKMYMSSTYLNDTIDMVFYDRFYY